MPYLSIVLFGIVSAIQAAESTAHDSVRTLLSTDEVENQISLDREANQRYVSKLLAPLRNLRDGLATAINLGT